MRDVSATVIVHPCTEEEGQRKAGKSLSIDAYYANNLPPLLVLLDGARSKKIWILTFHARANILSTALAIVEVKKNLIYFPAVSVLQIYFANY